MEQIFYRWRGLNRQAHYSFYLTSVFLNKFIYLPLPGLILGNSCLHDFPIEMMCSKLLPLIFSFHLCNKVYLRFLHFEKITLVMLKILQARLQQYTNQERPKYKLDLEKAEEPEIKLPTSVGS